jgi:23S rRNA pseudouridine2605 synthase
VLDLIDLPPAEKEGLFPVGRLDRDTQGVLLLTNDGELSHRLMHPSYQIDKLYRVRTRMPVKPDELARLRDGVLLDDGMARADQVAYVQPPDLHELGLLLHEGRNRQIRRMLEAIGHLVERLERVGYAGLTTEGLRRGKWRRLLPHEVTRLYRLVKLKR